LRTAKTKGTQKKKGNEQKSRGHRNESNGHVENEAQRQDVFEAAEIFTNMTERTMEKRGEQRSDENEENDRKQSNRGIQNDDNEMNGTQAMRRIGR
jgi:hypothetical protein